MVIGANGFVIEPQLAARPARRAQECFCSVTIEKVEVPVVVVVENRCDSGGEEKE